MWGRMNSTHVGTSSWYESLWKYARFFGSRIKCPLCVLFYTLLLGAASTSFQLHNDTTLILSLIDGWLVFALAPLVLYLLHQLMRFVWVVCDSEKNAFVPGLRAGYPLLGNTYLSPFLMHAILDRWRPRAAPTP